MRLKRADDVVYLDRWGWECRRFGVFLHRMDGRDPGMDLHDHPWSFVSVILAGGYVEERCDIREAPMWAGLAATADQWNGVPGLAERGPERRLRQHFSIAASPLTHAHRITGLLGKRSWSLVLHGPVRRPPPDPEHGGWGFYLPAGWVDWRTYERTVRAERRDMFAELVDDGHAPSDG